ncbi:ribosome maturation factor RimP [Pseudonocardia phyllosphaerae]|uniref:ribosome maturation factor RimP n=1 Tax=Pseudonocardia phyllosphaerae TaxID=3390502 RepID=UPI00397E7C1D
MRSTDPAELSEQLRGLLEPVVSDAGLEIDAVEVRTAGRKHSVKLVVDHPETSGETGIDLDAIAKLSRAAAAELDPHEHLIEGSYTLEVTSPGLDRPLTRPRDWRRNFLRLATITLTGGDAIEARIGKAGEERVQVAVRGTGKGRRPELRDLPYDEVDKARVEVEFKAPPAAETALLDPGGDSGDSGSGDSGRDGDGDTDSTHTHEENR